MNNFIPAFKGYERLGQFPLDSTSVFNSFEDAKKYASDGYLGRSSAYPGQRISIQNNNKMIVCVINQNYELSGVSSTMIEDSTTYIKFDYKYLNENSGGTRISLEQGSFLKTITVQILEPFKRANNLDSFAFTIGDTNELNREIFVTEEDLLTNEEGSYTIYINKIINEAEKFLTIVTNSISEFTAGSAIVKIN